MPELWLRKTFSAVVFTNTNIPEKRFRVCLNESEINDLLKTQQISSEKREGC